MQIRSKFRRLFLNLFYRKLWVKITPLFLIVVLIPVALLGILLIKTSEEALRKSELNNHKEIAVRASGEISLFIDRAKDILNTTQAMLSVLYPASWKQETVLVEVALSQPLFMRLASIDLSGRLIASSETARGIDWQYPKDILEEAGGKKLYISRVKVLQNNIPYVTMAVPVNKMGQNVGLLIADVNLRGVWDIVDSIRLGETGRAFLLADDGTLIAHQDKKLILKKADLSNQKDVQQALSGEAGAKEIEDTRHQKWISSYAPIGGLNWAIVLRQKQDEAYLFSKIMKSQSGIIIIIGEMLALFLSILMARALTAPIKTLIGKVKSIAEGDLEHKIELKRHDEIGEFIRSFNAMTDKLKQAKDKEQFALIGEASRFIAHELKNSLVLVKSFVDSFPQGHSDDKFVNKFSRLIPSEISRWERMIKELSDVSAQDKLNLQNSNICVLLSNTVEKMSEKLKEKKITTECILGNDNLCIMIDQGRMEQVFINLIVNAINAMPEGGSLTVSIKDDPEKIEIRIKDTGTGISSKDLGKIFNPFYTKFRNKIGLGLIISRKIVELHGGKISIESEIGKGATLIVDLPKNIHNI